MSKELIKEPGVENMKCDVCGKLAIYTCPTCLGDYCNDHREHGKGHK